MEIEKTTEPQKNEVITLDYYCSYEVLEKIKKKNPDAKVFLPNGKEV